VHNTLYEYETVKYSFLLGLLFMFLKYGWWSGLPGRQLS